MTVEDRAQHITIAAGAVIEGTPITVNWDVQAKAELAVLYGSDLQALLDVDYSVALVSGYKAALVTPLAGLVEKANGGTVTIRSAVPYVQGWSVPINSRLPENDLQRTEDRDVLRDRQLAERTDLALSTYFNNGAAYDAKGRRIITVNDPLNDQDAVNKRWVEARLSAIGVSAGAGVPAGGAAGAIFAKTSAADYVTAWRDPSEVFTGPDLYPERFILPAHPDDTLGIQAFIDALGATGGVGRLSRWYDVSGEIQVTATRPFSLIGVGRYVCGLNKTTVPGQILNITGDKVTVKRFGLKGNAHAGGYVGSSHGLALRSSDTLAESLWVFNWGLGTGIYFGQDAHNCKAKNCHVDGYMNAGNGILMSGVNDGVIEENLIENIHADLTLAEELQASPCRAAQFKRGVNGIIDNNRIKNCFYGLCLNANDDDEPSVNSRITGGIVSQPNTSQQSVVTPVGVYLGDSKSCSAEGVTVDGNNEPDFQALYIHNPDYAGAFARLKSTGCSGAGAMTAFIDAWEADVEIESLEVFAVKPVEFGPNSLTCRVRIGQIVGSSTAGRMHNPWSYVINSGNANNRAENLYDDITYRDMADDVAYQLDIADADSLIITVWTNGSGGEQCHGWARISSVPAIEAFFLGAGAAIGTAPLASGTTSGTDGKLNIAAVDGSIHVKNRLGGPRLVGIEVRTVF